MRRLLTRMRRHERGVAMLEFALMLTPLTLLIMTGAELTHYITIRMRVGQLALHLADNAARMGSGGQLSAKTVSETDINDVLTGAGLQAGEMSIYNNGRVIISDLEPMANPNTTAKYKIGWQRCRGAVTSHASTYGTAGQTNLTGMGPVGRQITAQDNNATMFIEVYYVYRPLIPVVSQVAPSTTMTEIASMAVRDRRDLSKIYNAENATVSGC